VSSGLTVQREQLGRARPCSPRCRKTLLLFFENNRGGASSRPFIIVRSSRCAFGNSCTRLMGFDISPCPRHCLVGHLSGRTAAQGLPYGWGTTSGCRSFGCRMDQLLLGVVARHFPRAWLHILLRETRQPVDWGLKSSVVSSRGRLFSLGPF
jgi:hypothetical protein